MTVLTRPAAVLGGPDLLHRRVTGTPAEVAATVAMVRDSGHLVAASVPRQLNLADPRVTVLVTVRRFPERAPAVRPVNRRRWVKPVVIAGTTAVALAGLLYGGYLLLQLTVRAAAAAVSPAVVGVLVVLALVLVLVGGRRKGVCVGLHCPGCGHR